MVRLDCPDFEEIETIRTLKKALNPSGILDPGKILRSEGLARLAGRFDGRRICC